MRRLAIPGLCVLLTALIPIPGRAQDGHQQVGRVTYVSGDVYYISLGSGDGMKDSLLVTVTTGGDAASTLKIFAVSSRSSACRIVSGTRPPKVGDAVSVSVRPRLAAVPDADSVTTVPAPATAGDGTSADGLRDALNTVDAGAAGSAGYLSTVRRPAPVPPVIRAGGRVTAQYQTYLIDTGPGSITQPSLSVSLRADARDVPVKFEFAGSLRSSVTGTSAPFSPSAANRTRIYRLVLEYDDGDNRFGAGRLIPSMGIPSGYIDGLAVGKRLGLLEFGVAAGYEPDMTQRTFSTERRKVMVFAGTGNRAGAWSFNGAFAETFLGPAPERSVASAAAFFAPSPAFNFSGQTEVDFLNVKNSQTITRPKLSSLLATMNFRATSSLTLGAGLTAWRPVYPVSVLTGLADSLADSRLWVSPTVSLRVYTAGGVSLQENYSPRTTPEGFGREYFNMFSLGHNDVLGSGVSLRGSQTLNRSSIASTTGYGLTLRRAVWTVVDAGMRYQYYRYVFGTGGNSTTSQSVGADLSFPAGPSLYIMLSGEFSHAAPGDYRLFSGSVSWRF